MSVASEISALATGLGAIDDVKTDIRAALEAQGVTVEGVAFTSYPALISSLGGVVVVPDEPEFTAGIFGPSFLVVGTAADIEMDGYIETSGPRAIVWDLDPVPAGCAFDTATAILSGTPTTAALNACTLTAADPVDGRSLSVQFDITVVASAVAPTITGTPKLVGLDGGGVVDPLPVAGAIYVDYDAGSDAAAGTAIAPRKTVPTPGPGNTIYLKRGSVYREEIDFPESGTALAPIIIDAESWGDPLEPAAVIDMGVSLSTSAGGTVNGVAVQTGAFPAHIPQSDWIDQTLMTENGDNLMCLAQLPTPADYSWVNNLDEWYDYAYSYTGTSTSSGDFREYVTSSALDNISGTKVGAILRVWQWGNLTDSYIITSYDSVTKRAEVSPYLHSRRINGSASLTTNIAYKKFAIINHPSCLTAPGMFLVDTSNWTVTIRPFEAGAAYATAGAITSNGCLDMSGSHITVKGLRVRMASGGSGKSGIVYRPTGGNGAGLVLQRCDVRNCAVADAGIYVFQGGGARPQNPLVEDCTVIGMYGESCRGIFFNGVDGGMMRGNTANTTSITGISLYQAIGTRVYGNVSGKPVGVHGNGFSFYEGCRDLIVAFNTVFVPEAGGMALTMQSSGDCIIAFNSLQMGGIGNTVAFYGPKERWAELGGHTIRNNVILHANVDKSVQIQAYEIWNGVPGKRVNVGDRYMDSADGRVWIANVLNFSGDSPSQTFAEYRAANPTHWSLYGGTGLPADWPSGRIPTGSEFVGNVVRNMLTRTIAGVNSWAARTDNMITGTLGSSTNLTPAESAGIGETIVNADDLFEDWRAGDYTPSASGWTNHLEGATAPWTFRGVTVTHAGRYILEGGEARDVIDWQTEAL